ncbi:MAG: tetratricopeptide repeat protein [FCB group bacterium]|nr:tetratricopeptide repeat protein [FCB group bacterium]
MSGFRSLSSTNRILPIVVVVTLGLLYIIPKLKTPESLSDLPGLPVLAVFPFESLVPDSSQSSLGAILQDLIITDLTGLRDYRILSWERLLDVQKSLLNTQTNASLRNPVLDIARSAEASALLTGRIIKMGSKTIITSKLLRSVDGVVINSHKVEGTDLFKLVDALSESIRRDLEPRESVSEPVSIPVAEKTSTSIPAYSEYLAGIQALNSAKYIEAIHSFDAALDLDPHFKKALFKKVMAQWWAESHGDIRPDATAQTLEKIQSRNVSLSNEEKFMVEGLEHLVHKQFNEARDVFQDLVHLRPDEKEYWYNLGEAYFHGGGEELRALDAMEHTLKLDPDFELAYVHILDIYMLRKFYERGLEFTDQILKKNPLHPLGVERRAQFLTVIGDFDQALDLLDRALNSDRESRRLKLQLAETHYFAGDYNQTVDICHTLMEQSIGRGDRMRCLELMASSYIIRGTYLAGARDILTYRGKPDSVWEQVISMEAAYLAGLGGQMAISKEWINQSGIDTTSRQLWYQKMIIQGFLAYLNGDRESWVSVQKEMKSSSITEKPDDRIRFSEYMECLNAMMHENYADVIPIGESLIKNIFPGPFGRYLLAIAYWKNGRPGDALTLTNQMQSLSFDPANYEFNYPRSFYLQTMIYSDMGDLENARRAYRNLEKIWRNVDESAPEWRQARVAIQTIMKGAT